MNNEEIKYLSEQSKETINNFFILRGFSSKKKFEKLLITKHKYENRYWEPDVTIVQYLLSQKDLKLSNSIIGNLCKLSQDWSSTNSDKENSLFLLMNKGYPIKEIINLADQFNIKTDQKNNEGLYFINKFLNEQYVENIIQQAYAGINNFPEIRLCKYLKAYQELIEIFPEMFKDTIQYEINKFKHIKSLIEVKEFEIYNKNKLGLVLNDEITKVNKLLLYLELDNQLKIKAIQPKRIKI